MYVTTVKCDEIPPNLITSFGPFMNAFIGLYKFMCSLPPTNLPL